MITFFSLPIITRAPVFLFFVSVEASSSAEERVPSLKVGWSLFSCVDSSVPPSPSLTQLGVKFLGRISSYTTKNNC